MNDYTLSILFNHSVTPAAVAAAIRARRIPRREYPFVAFLWLGFANETLSLILIRNGVSNALNSNLYVLAEYVLLLLQFHYWDTLSKRLLYKGLVLGTVIWLADNALLSTLWENYSLFRSYAAIVFIACSIDRSGWLIAYYNGAIARNAIFQICTAILVFFSCKLFIEIFHLFKVPFSNVFYQYLWLTLSAVNCIANIIYTIAVLCLPTRPRFISR